MMEPKTFTPWELHDQLYYRFHETVQQTLQTNPLSLYSSLRSSSSPPLGAPRLQYPQNSPEQFAYWIRSYELKQGADLWTESERCCVLEDVLEFEERARAQLLSAAQEHFPLLVEREWQAGEVVATEDPSLERFQKEMKMALKKLLSNARSSYGKASEIKIREEWNATTTEQERIQVVGMKKVPWFHGAQLCGKIDGYLTDGSLVEIKARVGTFVQSGLRVQEHLQVQAYMFMYGQSQCTVIEGLCRRNGSSTLRVRTVAFDAKLWIETTTRAQGIMRFCHELNSYEVMMELYLGHSKERQSMYCLQYIETWKKAAEETRKRRRC